MRAHKFAEIFPLLEGSELEALKADIAKRGVQVPVVTYQGEILDGRNRYRACQALGIECPTQEHTDDDPLACVLSLNLHRRHLNESQRAMAAKLKRTYGPAHCGQTIIIHVKDPEEDARLKTLPAGELNERLLHLSTTELAAVECRLYCTDFRLM